MIEFGKQANDEFVSRNLGPRAPLESLFEEPESQEESNARWKSSHALGPVENPRGVPEFNEESLRKLREAQQRPHEETLAEWKARTDYAADRAQARVTPEFEDAAVIRPVIELPTPEPRSSRVDVMKARIVSRMQEGVAKHVAVNEMLAIAGTSTYSRGIVRQAELLVQA